MKRKNATRSALFTSVVSLLLCVSMLVGTTFAWFTDSVSSVNNVITAGNLDIELSHKNVNDPETAYAPVGTESLFENVLWEPGHVEVVNLKIENLGTLALKYQFNVNVVSETGSINKDGNPFKLSDYIKFAIVDGQFAGTREVAIAAAEVNAVKVNGLNWTVPGEMEAGADAEYVTLVVWMPETVGNEANYKTGEVAPSITLGVNLFATQVEAESDSFGPDYDANAELCNFIVSSEEELMAALAEAKSGDVIGIKGNVTWTTGGAHSSTPFMENPATITLLGVDEDATFTAIGSGVGPIGIEGGTVVFRDLKIADESVSYAEGSWEFGYLEFRGNTVFENCDIVNAIMMEGDSASFINCSFNSNKSSEYAVWVDNGDATFENCYFTGTRGVKVHEAYGSEVGTVVINNNTFAALTEKPGLAIGTVNADTTISLTNNLFAGTQPGDQNLYKYETDTDVTTFSFTDENNIVRENSKVIASAADLLALSGKRADGEVILVADIDLGGADFNAIIVNRGTTLTFVGNGHTISNVNIVGGPDDNTTGQASMFYAYPNATLNVSDLTLEKITVKADENDTGYAAAVVGYCEGAANLTNVDVVNATIVGVKSSGALVGHLSGSLTATDCDVSGTVTLAENTVEANGHYAGRYIGTMAGAVVLNNCTANVTVSGQLHAANDGAVYGRKTAAGSLVVDGAQYVATANDLANAVANGATNLYLADGVYENITGCAGKTLTISGSKNAVLKVKNEGEDGCDYDFGGSAGVGNITFNGVTIDTTANTGNYKGYAYMKGTFNDCNFVGAYSLKNANDFVFNRCTFDFKNGYFWTWAAKSVTFDGCTFNGNSKTILAHGTASTVININNCTFAATEKGYTGAGDNTAVVEMDPVGTNTYTINFTGENTKTDSYAGWTRVKDGSTGHTVTGVN